MPLREDAYAEDVEAMYRDKINKQTPKYAPVVMRADPGVVYLDAQLTKLLEKQEEVLAGQRRQGKEIAELKAMLESLTRAVSDTNLKVSNLKDQIVPPLHNVMHDHAETTLQTIAHYSGEKIVAKTIHDVLPKLSNTLAQVVTKTVEDQLAASEVLQDLDLALKQGTLGGRGARNSAVGRTSMSMRRQSQEGDSSAPARPSGPELWKRSAWIQWLRTNVSLFKSLTEQEVADVFDNSTECYKVDRGTPVVEQGEDGTSMFVLVQGELNVFITNPEVNRGQPLMVTVLSAGQFFGEMSLLTGELRAATVSASASPGARDCYVLEVSQEGLQPVLARRPNLATALGEVVAERMVKNQDSYREAPEETKRQRRTSMVGRVMASVNNTIFGGGGGGGTAGARWSQQQHQRAGSPSTSVRGGGGGGEGARRGGGADTQGVQYGQTVRGGGGVTQGVHYGQTVRDGGGGEMVPRGLGARSSTGTMGAMGAGKVPRP